MKIIIKKHVNKNHYLLTPEGYWVRDFTKKVFPQDINNLITDQEFNIFAENELTIKTMNIANIDNEFIRKDKVVIVSDGHQFESKKHLLKKLPRDVVVIGTNRSLAKWSHDIRMDYFLINNPYKEAMSCLPNINYIPKCIVSCRTYPNFIKFYRKIKGVLFKYVPTKIKKYGSINESAYYVDDYRNPICASINLAYRWGVKKLMLFCCDDVFSGERQGSIKVKDDFYMYPQHKISHSFIDGCMYWLKRQEFNQVQVVDHSQGVEYQNAPYIKEDDIEGFFR